MIDISFKQYLTFSECPIWWKNFCTNVHAEVKKHNLSTDTAFAIAISNFNGHIIDSINNDVDSLQFETESDYNAFRVYWTLYGK